MPTVTTAQKEQNKKLKEFKTLKAHNAQRKNQSLRNIEYYDFQDVLDDLYDKSVKGYHFYNLMDYIEEPQNIRLAYRNIKKNQGSKTPGIDGKTILYLSRLKDETLVEIVQKKFARYNPQKVKRVEIPKDNGKTRPLGIPTIMDRLLQQCILQILEPIVEAKFHNRSHGFRPNRSCETALAQFYVMAQKWGLQYVVDFDIKGFFDNVNHGKLLKQMWSMGIRDKRLLKIISLMLKAEVAGIGFPERGTPQGGIISPILANIVLNELDWWIESQWASIPTVFPYKPTSKKSNGTYSMGNKYAALKKNSNLKEVYFVRYADDFKLLCRHRKDAENLYWATKLWLKDRLELDINEDKSGIVNLKKKHSDYLGFKIKLTPKGKKKNGEDKWVISSHISDKNMMKIRNKAADLIHEIGYPIDERRRRDALWMYNSYVMGIHNYYSLATNVNVDLHKIAFSLKDTIKSKLGDSLKKEGTTGSKFITEKYGKSKELRYIGKNAMIPIGYCQCRAPMHKPAQVNKYTKDGRTAIHKNLSGIDTSIIHYLMRNPVKGESIEFNDNRISLYVGQQGKCAVTQAPLTVGEMEVHHKEESKDDSYKNLIIILRPVHRLIHATNDNTIEWYLEKVHPDQKQLAKINKLRNLKGLPPIEAKTNNVRKTIVLEGSDLKVSEMAKID